MDSLPTRSVRAGPDQTRTSAPRGPDLLAWSADLARDRLPQLARTLQAQLSDAEPFYREREEDSGEARELLRSLLELFLASMRELHVHSGTARLARKLGRHYALHGLPVEPLSHGYRILGSLLWQTVVETVTARRPDQVQLLVQEAETFWRWLYRDIQLLLDSYQEAVGALESDPASRTRSLLDGLLTGRFAALDLVRVSTELGIPTSGRFALAVVEAVPGAGNAQLGDAVDAWARHTPPVRVLCAPRAQGAVFVVYLGDRPVSELAAALSGTPGTRVGVSPEVEGLSELPRAERLADLARRTCTADGEVAKLDERLPTALLVCRPDLAGALAERAFHPLNDVGLTEGELLLRTLGTWLDCDGSTQRTAARMYCHRNTVHNRLRRLEQLTGRSLARPRDIVELSLALDAHRLTRAAQAG